MELLPEKQPQFISLFQFFKMFPTEEVCARFFEESRWPSGVRCPRCDSKESVRVMKSSSNLYTDENRAYIRISGYNHKMVKHKVGQYVNKTVSTNGIESFWAILKRAYIGTYHHISEKHLHRYVSEFATRHNMKDMSPIECFAQTARMMVDKRLTYNELKA